jgi:small-conductance mechanosensitive channel
MRVRFIAMVLFFLVCISSQAPAEDIKSDNSTSTPEQLAEEESQDTDKNESSLKMLRSISELKKGIDQRIREKAQTLKKSSSEAEKDSLKFELERLDKQLNDYSLDFERIATGIDIGLFAEKKAEEFDWKNEVVSLIEPGIKEIKRLTVRARYKTKLKDERSYYQNLKPIARQAVENINHLIGQTDDGELKKKLAALLPEWKGVEKQIQSKLEIVGMQLAEMEGEEKSILETSRTSIKNFFRTRGLFLFIALVSCLGMIFFLRLSARFIVRFIPGYTAKYRPFHVRVLSLLFRILALVLTFFVLIFVFYLVEDWVLLSLTIIFIMGLGWAVKHTLPQFWHQSRLMLNIGSVREGERMMLHGVPWLVKTINVFSELENPSLGVRLRLPIEELLGKTSRPFHKNEPWFPCKRNDWVILSDDTRGVVTSLSHEMVELVQRGGSRKIYQTADFMALSPLNISVNFRLKVLFGISYDLQKDATTRILSTLESHISEQIDTEGYGKNLLNLRVEFAQAGASSLDILVIADFKGELAPLYQRLSRAIQRWCVDACTLNNWEIPFPQLTIHQ